MANVKSKEKNSNPIGASLPRNDVYEKVTGTAVYTEDIQFGKNCCMPEWCAVHIPMLSSNALTLVKLKPCQG